MAKVLSTKLKADEIECFTAMAEKQGKSKAGLLNSLVLNYINEDGKVDGKVDGVESSGRPRPIASSVEDPPLNKTNHNHGVSPYTSPSPGDHSTGEGLHSRAPIAIHHSPTTCTTPASTAEGLPDTTKVEYHVDLPTSSRESLPVYLNKSKGRPEASTMSSTGKGLLLCFFLLALRSKYGPSIGVDRKSVSTT